jgi:Dolichyl-phosphate-mannose-protein mannosyltransferase
MINRRNLFPRYFAVLLAILGLFLIALTVLPYGTLRVFTDSLAVDHNFNSLKPWNVGVFKVIFGAGGLIFLILATLTGFRRWNLIVSFLKQNLSAARLFFAGLRPQKRESGFLVVLLAIIVLGIIYRLERIYSPFGHDEAYTYVAFARSLFTAISDYNLPNNHVFHTILVYFSTQFFGNEPWAVRLPAFIAGVLLIPATYWLAKRLYGSWVALAAALLVAWFPPLVAYANDARGYTLVALFTLLTLVFGDIVRKNKNLFAWGLISLFSALGFYTIPIMLFPFGVLFVWLFLENLVEGPGPYRTKWEFIWYWLAAGLGAAILTLLFYTPIFIYSGPATFFANRFIAPVPWRDFLETLASRFTDTRIEFTARVPLAFTLIFAAGWILSVLFHRRLSETRIPLQLAAIIWILVLLLLQRPNAWARMWVFLLPLMLVWAAAGLFGFLEKVRPKMLYGLPLTAIVFGLVMLVGIWQSVRLIPQLPKLWTLHGDDENAVLFVQSQLQEQDLIVVSPPDDAPIWYYSELHGIPDARFDTRSSTFERILILVNKVEHQTPASVIADRGPEAVALDIESSLLLNKFGKIQVFETLRR